MLNFFLVTTIISEIFSGYHCSFFCTFVSSFLFFVFWSVRLFRFLIEKCGILFKKGKKIVYWLHHQLLKLGLMMIQGNGSWRVQANSQWIRYVERVVSSTLRKDLLLGPKGHPSFGRGEERRGDRPKWICQHLHTVV